MRSSEEIWEQLQKEVQGMHPRGKPLLPVTETKAREKKPRVGRWGIGDQSPRPT